MSAKTTRCSPQPVRLDEEENRIVRKISKRSRGRLSLSDVIRRAVRFAGPKMISGEIPLVEMDPEVQP